MRALILNDTRRGSFARYPGCVPVMEHLLELCRAHEIEIVAALTRVDAVDTPEFAARLSEVDAVIVNGEGTMHHDTPGALALARGIVAAKFAGKKTALLREIEIPELIAEDEDAYVALAVKLGTEAAYRRQLSERILAAMALRPRFINPAAYAQGLGELIAARVTGKKLPAPALAVT